MPVFKDKKIKILIILDGIFGLIFLSLLFVALGLTSKTEPAQAANSSQFSDVRLASHCTGSAGYFCQGGNRWYRTTHCYTYRAQVCSYGCSGSSCNPPPCSPSCTGNLCGQSNGCGGTCPSYDRYSCGKCGNPACCTPNCSGKQCGSNGCGGSCGSCNAPNTCNGSGQCTCTPSCTGNQCGQSNGCGGSCPTTNIVCGVCGGSTNACGGCGSLSNQPGTSCTVGTGSCARTGTWQCNGGTAVRCSATAGSPATCSSLGKQCGSWSNGCGGTLSCGSCGPGTTCNVGTGQCVCADNSSTCNYNNSCSTTGTNNCGVQVSRCDRITSTSANWSAWGSYGSCSTTCGTGTKTRYRTCVGTATCGGANNCLGLNYENAPCSAGVVNGTWTGACTVSCGGGQNTCTGTACGGTCQPPNTTSCNTQSCCTPVNNTCGTNVATYGAGTASWPGTFCTGTAPSPTPGFPAQGSSVSWNCSGNSCGTGQTCTAYRKLATPSISVSPTTVAAGGNVLFTWGAISNVSYYQIQYRRDGNWGSWSNIGNTVQQNYNTSGLTSTAAAQVQACSSTLCGDVSNQATATIAPVPTATLNVTSASIGYNTASNLYWSSSNATACSVSPGSFSTVANMPLPGQSTGALLSSQTYTLSCSGTGGTGTSQKTVTVAAPTLSVSSFTATPASGTAPVNGVDFAVNVGGNAIGNIQYQIDCTNDSFYELDVVSASNPYTAVNLCNYPNGGSYTARTVVRRSGQTAASTAALNIFYPTVTVDIKAAIGQATPADSLNAPVGSTYTLSWTTTGSATSCRTDVGGSWAQPNQSLPLTNGAGSTSRVMSSSTETYPITCSNPGGSGTDTITIRPVPVAPPNLRITSSTPYVKGNTISFAWDAPPAASYYVVTYYLNGVAATPATSPSPAYAATIAYTNTSSLNSIGAAVVGCTGSGVCGSPTAVLTATLTAPTPSNTTPTAINTTSGGATGYSGTLATPTDVQYARLPTSATDHVYRLQTSGSIIPTMAVVDSTGNNIAPAAAGDIQISGNTATVRVPANATYYIKFTGASGSFTYGFQRYRGFPYYQGQL